MSTIYKTVACDCWADMLGCVQVHSYRNRVLFTAAAAAVPKDAILVELGPHALLRSPLRQSRPELAYVSLMRKGECGAATLAAAISELWRKGASINWQTDAVPSGVKGAECEFCSPGSASPYFPPHSQMHDG